MTEMAGLFGAVPQVPEKTGPDQSLNHSTLSHSTVGEYTPMQTV